MPWFMARLLHDYISRYEPLRYPLPPLNQSSYTIFSFHRLAGSPPLGQSFFCGHGPGVFPVRSVFSSRAWHPVITSTIFPVGTSGGSVGPRFDRRQRLGTSREAVQPRVSQKSPNILRQSRGSANENHAESGHGPGVYPGEFDRRVRGRGHQTAGRRPPRAR